MFKKIGFLLMIGVLFLTGCTIGGGETVKGVYEYAANAAGNTYYSASVTVKVKDEKIVSVTLDDDSDVRFNLTQSWANEDKLNWTDNQAAFLDSFKGKTIQEILSIVVNVIDTTQGYSLKGQPETIEGYVDAVAGATQSSGRVILAIQDALSKIQTAAVF